ncbi:MAG TPA: thiopurine S-methyltransferase, partial [Hellea balneolensis]|nr:thiopurine S-methyltransferase [Hellea balneolensis]
MHDPKFWLEKWDSGQIGFHQDTVHPWLDQYWPMLNLDPEAPVFVPLCG